MLLTFVDVYYDVTEDLPVAVMEDAEHDFYYIPVSCSNAEDLIAISVSSKNNGLFLKGFIKDLLKYSSGTIANLKIDRGNDTDFIGELTLKIGNKQMVYPLSAGEVILISSLFNVEIIVENDKYLNKMQDHKYSMSYKASDPDVIN